MESLFRLLTLQISLQEICSSRFTRVTKIYICMRTGTASRMTDIAQSRKWPHLDRNLGSFLALFIIPV